MPKAFLLNDTSTHVHAGCRSTIAAMRFKTPIIVGRTFVNQRDTPEDFAGADTVVLNGEGSIHHGARREWPTYLVEQLRRAQAIGLRTCWVNSVYQDNPPEWGEILARCWPVSARETLSAERMREAGCPHVETWTDLSLEDVHAPRAPGPHYGKPVLGDVGASGMGGLWNTLASLVQGRATMARRSLQDVVNQIAGCRVYLTGQWHGVIAAAVAGVPFAAVPSNSHKTEALLAWADLGLRCRTPDEMLAAAVGDQEGIGGSCESFKEFSRWLCTQARMPDLRGVFA